MGKGKRKAVGAGGAGGASHKRPKGPQGKPQDQSNEFNGWNPPPGAQVPTASARTSAADFFRDFVLPRKPAVFDELLADREFVAADKWTHEYMRKMAGDEPVKVEFRESGAATFGQGCEREMTFGDFLDKMERKEHNWYFTTQELGENAHGQPDLMSAPITQLLGDIPLRPALLSPLIVQNINLWQGYSRSFSTTGLHHDFHDNLYVLLKGRKRFTLYSPALAHHMYTRGRIAKVHPNGRINFEGQETKADGAHEDAEKAQQLHMQCLEAEAKLVAAESRRSGKGKDKAEEGDEEEDEDSALAEAERELDDALDALLDGEEGDDYVDSDAGSEQSNPAPFTSPNAGKGKGAPNNDDDDDDDDAKQKERSKRNTTSKEPLNFSLVPRCLQHPDVAGNSDEVRKAREAFPRFAEVANRKCVVELKAGQMLFLPAGWFHEVESRGDDGDGDGEHMALNYWFHPPDGRQFDKPYTSGFWQKDWELRGLD